MTSSQFRVHLVRLDIPLSTTTAYLFVDPESDSRDEWWARLHEYLLAFRTPELQWTFEPVQAVFVARPSLVDRQKEEIVGFLRCAPPGEIESNRTLGRAVSLSPGDRRRIGLVYFSRSDTE